MSNTRCNLTGIFTMTPCRRLKFKMDLKGLTKFDYTPAVNKQGDINIISFMYFAIWYFVTFKGIYLCTLVLRNF